MSDEDSPETVFVIRAVQIGLVVAAFFAGCIATVVLVVWALLFSDLEITSRVLIVALVVIVGGIRDWGYGYH